MYKIGKNVILDLYGTSHGPCVGCILTGIPAGIEVSFDFIQEEMELRRSKNRIGTERKEPDIPEFKTGIKDGKTTGDPITIEIKNTDTKPKDYEKYNVVPRPGHADYTRFVREDNLTGGGSFSGRLTAPIVAAGAIVKEYLKKDNFLIAGFVRSVGTVEDIEERSYEDAIQSRNFDSRACTSELNNLFIEEIENASKEKDSIGGVVECIVNNLPAGFGDAWFDSLESKISSAMFGIPGVKGIEFGDGFALTKMKGSESNDSFAFDEKVITTTNHSGGILGGYSTGMPLVFRVAFKPTPSIGKEQHSVNLETRENVTIAITGRHDPCIATRAVAVVEAMTALVLADYSEDA